MRLIVDINLKKLLSIHLRKAQPKNKKNLSKINVMLLLKHKKNGHN